MFAGKAYGRNNADANDAQSNEQEGDTHETTGTRFQMCERRYWRHGILGRGQRRPFGRAPPPRLVRLGG